MLRLRIAYRLPLPTVCLGDVAVVGTAGTIPRLINPVYNQMVEFIQSVIQPNLRAHLSIDDENSQMMGRVGPITASSTPKILIIQYFPNQTFIYTPTSAYTTYRYGTSPHQEYLLEFTSEYGISEALHSKLPGPEDRIVDFPEGKGVPTIVDWRKSAPKDGMPAENTNSPEAVIILNTHRTPIQKQPEALLCLVGLSRRYYLGDEVYLTFLHNDYRDIALFNLIRAPNPTKVKTGSCPRAAHKVPLLTVTANRVIEMEELAAATDSLGVPSTIERSPLDFANENPSQQSTGPEDQEAAAPEVPPPENVTTTGIAPEAGPTEKVAATGPPAVKERRKSLAAIELRMGFTHPIPTSQGVPVDVSDPDPLYFADPQSRPLADVTQSSKGAVAAKDSESENTSFASMVRSPESIYRPELGITNGCLLDAPEACQDLVNHIAPPGYFSELRHLHNDDFLKQYNVNLAWQVAMGSQLWLRFEQKAKLLKKSVAPVARRDKRIQARENEIKNLETLLEAEADMKKTAENKSAKLSEELENMRALFSDLQVSNNRLSQQVSSLQEQVMREEKLKAAFEEFKQNKHDLVEQRCAEMDARLDALSIDFDEELYPHMLTAIAGRISKGMEEGLNHRVEHGKAKLDMEAIEAYDPKAEAKYIAALHALKNLKYPLVDQLESLKDAPMDVIMASLHLESDTGDDAPYRAEKKKECRVVCRTHGVSSAHHARSDGIPVSVPTVAPQGLAILLADAATQTDTSDKASPRLLRSSSLPIIHG
uniref:peroxidase n=1 Tax=Tanacetum cinerariifolium TaxID=118510 RepID=A0A6L2MC19_TANCI|nr:hypothetical protein [Tanacetum cinerariifolium]